MKMKHSKIGKFKSWKNMMVMVALCFIGSVIPNRFLIKSQRLITYCINTKKVNTACEDKNSVFPRLNGKANTQVNIINGL